MKYEILLFVVVILCFSTIHFIEVSSYLARFSGVRTGDNALAYATQSAVLMVTRFFSMLLLPVLGLIIDLQVAKKEYVLAVCFALFGAFLGSVLAISLRGLLVSCFSAAIAAVKGGQSLFVALARLPFRIISASPLEVPFGTFRQHASERMFWYSSLVFSVYAASIFLSFYFALLFPQFRTSISQLSAVSNAFASILLTFYVEPKISVSIDRAEQPGEKIMTMLAGRLVGVGALAFAPFLVLLSL
jgi:hypothetical protein